MIDTSKVQTLLQQEVSRKEFLRYTAIAILSFIGVTNFLKNINQPLQLVSSKSSSNKSSGYGMSAYGR